VELHPALRQAPSQEILEEPITADEIAAASKKLHSQSSCTGVPIPVLKMLLADEDVRRHIAQYLDNVLQGKTELPTLFTTLVLTPVVKPGKCPQDVNNYRKLMHGDSLSRLFQVVLMDRLLRYFYKHGVLHECQAGFVLGNSVELASWFMDSILGKYELLGQTIYALFVDFSNAFDSAQHDGILRSMAALGIRPDGCFWKLMAKWLGSLSASMVDGSFALLLVALNIGTPQGAVFSPGIWNAFIDSLIKRVLQVCDNGIDVPTVNGHPAAGIGFADDLTFLTQSLRKMQLIVNSLSGQAKVMDLKINLSAGKTELLVIHPPNQRRKSQHCQSGVEESDSVRMDGALVLRAESYKHLGRMISGSGRAASFRLQAKVAIEKYRTATAMLSSSGFRDAPVGLGRTAIVSHVRAAATYGFGIWATPKLIQPIITRDVALQRAVLWSFRIPEPVVRSVMGLRSLCAEIKLARMRLLLKILALPDDRQYRQMLVEMVSECRSGQIPLNRRHLSWWTMVEDILTRFDELEMRYGQQPRNHTDGDDAVNANVTDSPPQSATHSLAGPPAHGPARGNDPPLVYEGTGTEWLQSVLFILDTSVPLKDRTTRLKSLQQYMRHMVEWDDWMENQTRMRHMSSLSCTMDIMDNATYVLPCIRKHRTLANLYRIHLRGGAHYLFGYRFHNVLCPWCGASTLSTPHLLRDCPKWKPHRRWTRHRVRHLVSTAELLGAVGDSDDEVENDAQLSQLWYRLVIGAPVPSTFMDFSSLFGGYPAPIGARASESHAASVASQKQQTVYGCVMKVSGELIITTIQETQKLLGVQKSWEKMERLPR
jgi:hypothetical protein